MIRVSLHRAQGAVGRAYRFVMGFLNDLDRHHVFNGAAALAFYLMLAMVPAAIATLSLLPYLPIENVQQAMMEFIPQALPGDAASLMTRTLASVMSQKHGGILSIGLLVSLWAASSGLFAIMQQLNISYEIPETRPFWKTRGLSVILSLLFLVLVIGAFALITLGGVLQGLLQDFFGPHTIVFSLFALVRWIVIVYLLLLSFALIYHFGPNRKQPFRLITRGSVAGTTILTISTIGFRIYVSNFANYNASYGSLGAVIILQLWLYIVGLVFLVGFEINTRKEKKRHKAKLTAKPLVP